MSIFTSCMALITSSLGSIVPLVVKKRYPIFVIAIISMADVYWLYKEVSHSTNPKIIN